EGQDNQATSLRLLEPPRRSVEWPGRLPSRRATAHARPSGPGLVARTEQPGGDMDLGAPELLIILAIGLLIFGANKLPKLARSLGQASKEFKAATTEPFADLKTSIAAPATTTPAAPATPATPTPAPATTD